MNKINLAKAGTVLAAVMLLASCDPQTCGTAYITNKSSDTVDIIRTGSDPKLLAPGQVEETGPLCGLGLGQTPYSVIAGTEQILRDTVACKKDIRDEKNWVTTKPGKYDYEHRFTVTDADF